MKQLLSSRVVCSFLLSALLVALAAGCLGPTVVSGPAFKSAIGYRAVEPTVATRRLTSTQPLTIVVADSVLDVFTVSATRDFRQDYSEYRRTLQNALQKAFSANFPSVAVATGEGKKGLELVVLGAEIQPSNTIKFHVVLQRDGQELVDAIGETDGQTVAMKGNYEAMRKEYPTVVEQLFTTAVKQLCEKVYDSVMRDERVEKADFWATATP